MIKFNYNLTLNIDAIVIIEFIRKLMILSYPLSVKSSHFKELN